MKITEIRCAGLRGATPEGGWSNELRPDDCVHTLIAVHTDEGAVGLGSVFTNDALVRASLAVLERLPEAQTIYDEAKATFVGMGAELSFLRLAAVESGLNP